MSQITDESTYLRLEEFSYSEAVWIADAVNGRMDNCGGGGQRLPPDGDEFPAAYQEFTSPSQQYQYVTTRETMAANGDVDRGESLDSTITTSTSSATSSSSSSFIPAEKAVLVSKSIKVAESRSIFDKKDLAEFMAKDAAGDMDSEKRSSVSNYVLYSSSSSSSSTQKNLLTEKKIEIAGYYPKDAASRSEDEVDADMSAPPPLPLTGPPKLLELSRQSQQQERKFSNGTTTSNNSSDLWRQDNKSEKSVKDKIAMFSSQSSLEAPLFPSPIPTSSTPVSSPRRLSKHKSSDDVLADEKKPTAAMSERTQSSFDLSLHASQHKKTPSLPLTSPPTSPGGRNNGYSSSNSSSSSSNSSNSSSSSSSSPVHLSQKSEPKYSPVNSASSSKSSSPLNSYSTAYGSPGHLVNKSFDASPAAKASSSAVLTRATSFSGSLGAFASDKLLQTSSEVLGNGTGPAATITRTSSLASTFKRPSDEMRKSSLNQLIEQRRKGISKLRGLVIPEKDAVSVDQPIIDLPEIKSRESILVNNQTPRSNIHDKWGSQSSLASNASTVSSSLRTNTSFKMPAPKILSSYSPAFKRKSLAVYNNTNGSQSNNSSILNGSKTNSSSSSSSTSTATTPTGNQLSSPASDAPKSLESICSPTRSDYSFDFVSSSGSPENNQPASRPKLSCQRKIGRHEYDDSDNDSAVSSSQSSISRGFSPATSPVPSDRSTISSERSYLSSETHYQQQRPQLILDSGKTNGGGGSSSSSSSSNNNNNNTDKLYTSNGLLRSSLMSERSFSVPEKSPKATSQQSESRCSSHIPQRQALKRSSSTETNSSNSSTLTSGSQASAESLSRRVLKPQSVEAINRKNILASARCRSGRDLNGSPLIQRKFADEEEAAAAAAAAAARLEQQENGLFVSAHRIVSNGHAGGECRAKPEIKIAYIEITESVGAEEEEEEEEEEVKEQQQPRLPPKRSVIPQAKNVPIPTSRPPKPEAIEPSNDIKSWVRSEMRNLANSGDRVNSYEPRKKGSTISGGAPATPSPRTFRSKSTLALNEQSPSTAMGPMGSRSQSIDGEADLDLIDTIKPRSRSNFAVKKAADSDLLTVLTTKSRSRSAIHIEESSYGKLKSQMSLEDILSAKNNEPISPSSKLPRSLSISSDQKLLAEPSSIHASETFKADRSVRRSNSTDSWSDDKINSYSSKIPSLSSRTGKLLADNLEEGCESADSNKSPNNCSKIPMSRNLGRRSASVTDMKKVFEKVDHSLPAGNLATTGGQSPQNNTGSHNRFPSLDSSVEDSMIRPVGCAGGGGGSSNNSGNNSGCEPDVERFSGEQFGSISSLASSTSLISQQELAQLVEEANLEEPRGGHDIAVVLLHKENPAGSVGIILAGGLDCETKEITIHRVLTHSIADKEGSVQRGDRILSINGRSMRGLTHRESLAVLKQPRSEVVLVVSRAKAEESSKAEDAGAKASVTSRLRSRAESVETIVEGCKTNGLADNTAWGPPLVVAMYKDGTGLGFSLEGGHDSPLGDRPLLIKKIFTGGAAEKTGALRAGDQLLEVNDRDVSRMSRIEAWSLMKKLPDGEVGLLVRHPATKSS